ncbi:hypothetical protein EYF80_066159 [Liparis tanakae]|uniref:Uncharacterized protein n=1 Tax=Liparis tanakae TaxID=230148 RepID=A0A4Z2E4N8_9TELE|nr:hypothetical protein EYF80_066159 [Liparis tanakae]
MSSSGNHLALPRFASAAAGTGMDARCGRCGKTRAASRTHSSPDVVAMAIPSHRLGTRLHWGHVSTLDVCLWSRAELSGTDVFPNPGTLTSSSSGCSGRQRRRGSGRQGGAVFARAARQCDVRPSAARRRSGGGTSGKSGKSGTSRKSGKSGKSGTSGASRTASARCCRVGTEAAVRGQVDRQVDRQAGRQADRQAD